KVAVEGWAETSQVTALEIAQRFEDAGVAAIIFTDIARDGLLKGLNLDATIALAERISIPIIASGGFASIEDVKALLAPRAKKLAGAIAGRALYDGRLDPAAALARIRAARAAAANGCRPCHERGSATRRCLARARGRRSAQPAAGGGVVAPRDCTRRRSCLRVAAVVQFGAVMF